MKSKLILGSTAALAGMAFGAKANVAHADSVNAGSTQTVSQMNTSTNNASQAPTVSTPVQSSNATTSNNVSSSASAVKAQAVSQPVAQKQVATSNAQQGHPVELDTNTNPEISNSDTVNTTDNDGLTDKTSVAPSAQDPFGFGGDETKGYGNVASINGDNWLNGEKKSMYHVINSQNGNSLNIKANSIEKGTSFTAKISNGTLSFTNSSGKQLPTSSGKPYGESGMTDVGVGTEGDNKALWGINPSTGIGTMIEDNGSLQTVINNGQKLLHSSSNNVAYIGYDAKATGKDDPYSFDGLLIIQDRGNGFVEIWRDYSEMSNSLYDANGKISIEGVNNFPDAIMLEDAKITKNADGSVTVSGKPVGEFNDIKLYRATNPTEWTHTFVNNLLAGSNSGNSSSSNNTSSSTTPSTSGNSSNNGNSSSTTNGSSSVAPSDSTANSTSSSAEGSNATSGKSSVGSDSSSATNSVSSNSSTVNSSVANSSSSTSSTDSNKDNGSSAKSSDESNSSSNSLADSNNSANGNSSNSSSSSNASSDENNNAVTPSGSDSSSSSASQSSDSSNSNSNSGLPDTGSNGAIALAVIAGLVGASVAGVELAKKRA